MRPYTESFEPDEVNRITEFISDLDFLGGSPTNYKLFTSEIANCLSMGLLLAAVSVSASLLELFVRDLAVFRKLQAKAEGDLAQFGDYELDEEGDKKRTFESQVSELEGQVVLPAHAKDMLTFYTNTRVPFAHGLIRRLSDTPILQILNLGHPLGSRNTNLEDRIEETALDEIGFVIHMLKQYRPWLTRRYEQA